ncbi:unnamed protein product [Coregonus sp. 'balchen']|nr:unnamed protein product [Coregonus sp. 'balchen']
MLRDDDPNIKMTFENNIAILSITTVAISHGGKYTCQAENEAGQNKCEATLTVQEPARILEKAESINVTSGESATLECKIAGSPELKVKWFQDGKEMKGSRKYKITLKDNIAILKILASEKVDSSEYTMEVSNRVGKDQCSCSITVLDRIIPPSFTRSLKRLDGIMGNDISMDCKVSGSQPMTLSWFKDDKEIKSGDRYLPELKDNSAALKITQLEKVDAGVYTCRATNSAGSKESSGTLYVKEPPIFTLKPDNQDVIPGSTVVLKCAFTGTAPLMIKWFREDKEISSGGTFFIKKETSSSFLELHSVKPTDSANYHCQVANDAGKVACTAVLFVKEPPVFVMKLESTKLVVKGSAVKLECKATGTPEISFKWFKNEIEITQNEKYKMVVINSVASLEIVNCSVDDSGNYVCVASSDAGSDHSSSTVTVKEPPIFTRTFESKEVIKGSDIMLEGKLAGSAPFNVSFYKNTKAIRNDKRHKIVLKDDIVTLQILAIEVRDAGKYQCTIENMNSLVGSEISMQCTLKGSLPMTVSWLKDDHEVKDGEHAQMSFEDRTALLRILNIQTKHAGKYTCQAKNEAGSQKCSALLVVKGWLMFMRTFFKLLLLFGFYTLMLKTHC